MQLETFPPIIERNYAKGNCLKVLSFDSCLMQFKSIPVLLRYFMETKVKPFFPKLQQFHLKVTLSGNSKSVDHP